MTETDKLARILRNRADTGCAVHGQQWAEGMRCAANIIEHESASACDACARTCCTLDQVGIPCYYCHAGIFMGRRWWTFARDGMGRWLATPREDIDLDELAKEQARIRQAMGGADL